MSSLVLSLTSEVQITFQSIMIIDNDYRNDMNDIMVSIIIISNIIIIMVMIVNPWTQVPIAKQLITYFKSSVFLRTLFP